MPSFPCDGSYGDSANTVHKPQFWYTDEATLTLVESQLSSRQSDLICQQETHEDHNLFAILDL